MITHKHISEDELKEAVLDWLNKHQIFDRKREDITFVKYEAAGHPMQNYYGDTPKATFGVTVNFGNVEA